LARRGVFERPWLLVGLVDGHERGAIGKDLTPPPSSINTRPRTRGNKPRCLVLLRRHSWSVRTWRSWKNARTESSIVWCELASMCSGDGMRERCACTLCGVAADVHCEADAAFLCAPCDAQVHGANFLASRHRRTRVSPTPKDVDVMSRTATTSSSCVSTADFATAAALHGRGTTPSARRRGARGEAVLEGWARRMGLEARAAHRRAAAASRAIRAQVAAAMPHVPLRVAMAAALWSEVAAHGVPEPGEALRRLEACAHVPARLLVEVAAVSMKGDARKKKRTGAVDAAEDSWGECSIVSPHKTPSSPRPELLLFV
jgi:hypothetical protein